MKWVQMQYAVNEQLNAGRRKKKNSWIQVLQTDEIFEIWIGEKKM